MIENTASAVRHGTITPSEAVAELRKDPETFRKLDARARAELGEGLESLRRRDLADLLEYAAPL